MAQRLKPEIPQPDDIANRYGISVERLFTRAGIDPFSAVDWELRSAVIAGEDGHVLSPFSALSSPTKFASTASISVLTGTPRASAHRSRA